MRGAAGVQGREQRAVAPSGGRAVRLMRGGLNEDGIQLCLHRPR